MFASFDVFLPIFKLFLSVARIEPVFSIIDGEWNVPPALRGDRSALPNCHLEGERAQSKECTTQSTNQSINQGF